MIIWQTLNEEEKVPYHFEYIWYENLIYRGIADGILGIEIIRRRISKQNVFFSWSFVTETEGSPGDNLANVKINCK